MNSGHGSDLLLPEGANLLHIGPSKTGTTSLQFAMHERRDLLRRHGVVYPGSGTRPREAVWAQLGMPMGPEMRRERPRIERWHALVDEVSRAEHQRVCVSNEDFARADAEEVRSLVESLGAAAHHMS